MTRFVFRYRLFAWLCLTALLVHGIVALKTMSRREDPDTSPRNAQIIAIYPGASAAQVEQLLVDKIERTVLSQDDVKKVESVARPGIGTIILEAADNCKDFKKLWTDIRHRITDLQGSLPEGNIQISVNDRFTDASAMIYAVVWPQANDRQREDLARRLRDRLRKVTAVAEVSLLGEQGERVEVALSSTKLAAFHLNPAAVINALSRRNLLPQAGGSVAAGESRLTIQGSGELHDLQDLEQTIVSSESTPVLLRDVATVTRGYVDPSPFLVRVNGQKGVAVTMTMRKGENIVNLGEQVRREVASFQSTIPAGAELVLVNDLPTSVIGRVAEFYGNLRDGVLLILLVTYLFMGARSAGLVGIMLPLTILGTLAAMLALGREIQQMSITALIISLGLVVDNSVVVVDNIEHNMRTARDGEDAAIRGTDQIAVPLLTSNLTTVAAFLPIAFISGGKGEFIGDLGYVTTLATLVSLVLNMTILPLLAARFLKPVEARGVQRYFFRALDVFRNQISALAIRALRRPFLTTGLATVAALLAVLYIPRLGVQFFPSAQRNQFRIDVWLPEGSDITATEATVEKVETLLGKQQGIRSWIAYVGRGGPRFYYNISPEPPAANYAQLVVNTDSVSETARLVAKLRDEADATIPEARVLPQKLEQGPPLGAPISIRLSGEDIPTLRKAAEIVKECLAKVPGTSSIYHDFGEVTSTLKLEADEHRLAQLGLTDTDLAQTTRLSFSGITATRIRDGDREIPVELRLPQQERSAPGDVSGLYLLAQDGSTVPLSEVAHWQVAPGEGRIARRNHVRTLTVSAQVDGSRLASLVLADALPRLKALDLPPSVTLSYGGEQEEVDKSFRELAGVFFITVIVQLAIVAWEFNAMRIAVTILAAVPFSLSGAIFGLFLTGNPFGFTAFLGLITLGGVVTNHAIMFFEYARAGGSSTDSLLQAGRQRLRPILLTVLLSIGGLLPLGIGGGNLWPPMAWALIFGLLLSVVLAVVIVPSCYTVLGLLGKRFEIVLKGAVVESAEQNAT